ncbi:S41 family peptidase [Ideonella sp. BN130291]|uniref:S41 family peptidase n=1 Tax=Ideonella sp. BN130291 TaxID=3112940 RepID=UPI002E268353|nr:S41 family peptidase [Ideonella sp. BN130291]
MDTTGTHGARWRAGLSGAALAVLAACGGGGSSAPVVEAPQSCSVADQNVWLRDYMRDWYFWYGLSPSPDPVAYTSVDSYFQALLYPGPAQGTTSAFPADRWSFTQPTAEHELFFGEGKTLGYGLFVAGLEILDHPEQPLRVRFIEPKSPAALAGLQRGEQILSVNGRPASELAAANDFSALTPAAAGDLLTLQVRNASGDRTITLVAGVYDLTPVTNTSVVNSGGRSAGYLVLKDFVDQAVPSLESAFSSFKAAGVTDLVLDLRYNGGGLVSTASTLASYVAGSRADGQVFASLLYNDKHSSSNASYRFASLASALGVSRVYVLSGQRTCSASELVVNGLRPFVDVVLIGGTTCGKPVGFLPIDNQCGTTFNVVNFESVNANNQGRYFDGFQPTCAVADDLDHPLGSPSEALLAGALQYAQTGTCPPVQAQTAHALRLKATQRRTPMRSTEPGEHAGMVVR